jgi:hypothetical protein
MPQVLPVEHDAAAEAPANVLPPLALLDAKSDILRRTCRPPHFGQVTSLIASALRTNSSKAPSQVVQLNS